MIRASVVIPARGRTPLLARVLRLLDEQRCADFEAIVVADRCPETVRAVAELDLARPCRLYEIPGDPDSPFGAAEARNLGARFATGELLIFLDADCLVRPDHVEGFLSEHRPEGLLIAPIDFVSVDDWTKPIDAESRAGFGPDAQAPDGLAEAVWLGAQCWTGNMAVDRDAFLELGGFDLGFVGRGGEDVDYGLRHASRFGRVARAASRVRHVGPTAASAHARGEPGPLDNDGVVDAVESGRYAGEGDALAANGGAAYFADAARWEGFRDLRAAHAAREEGPPEDASATDVLQAQLERSAAALVAIARRLDRDRPLGGGEDEFLSLYAGLVAAEPAHFSTVWSDPQAYGWARNAFEALDQVVREPSAESSAALAAALERFKPLALACTHLCGARLVLDRGYRFEGLLALPGTPFTLDGGEGAELRAISADQVFLAAPGEAREGTPHDLAKAEGAVARCPTIVWRGETIRFQPATFRGATGEAGTYVVDAGSEYQAEHGQVLRDALDLVATFHPDAADLATWLQVVAFNRPGATDYGNTSSSELPGSVALIGTADPWGLAETLVHEMHHQRLFALEIEGPVFAVEEQNAAADFRHYSPWRVEPRPIKGLFHAFYVFVEVARFWLEVLDRSDDLEEWVALHARGRLRSLSLQLPRVHATICEQANLSAHGRTLFEQKERGFEDVLASIAEARVDATGSVEERTVRTHADQFDAARVIARLAPGLHYDGPTEPAPEGEGAPAPRISCVCVTRDRVERLGRAVRCFRAQTHPNRELVIVYEEDDADTAAYVEAIAASSPEIVPVRVAREPRVPLGELRNRGIAASGGEYVAQWDDDDWSHPERLTHQLRALVNAEGKSACVLSRWTVFDEARGHAYLAPFREWEGSLLCRKEHLPAYPPLSVGEDTPVVESLVADGLLIGMERPDLYVYVAHGGNTFPTTHFARYFEGPFHLGPEISAAVAEALAKGQA